MLLVESVLAGSLVTKREQIYCAGLSALLCKICWCCASMFSLILLCFCLRIPPYTFCLGFSVFINCSFHCSTRSSTVCLRRILQFNLGEWFTHLTGMLSYFQLLQLIWTSLGILHATMCFVEVEMEEPFTIIWMGTKKQRKCFISLREKRKKKKNSFDLIV